MKNAVFFLAVCFIGISGRSRAQNYVQQIDSFRQTYKQDFLTDAHSPLKAADTGFLRFYRADKRYKIEAVITLTPNSKPYEIATHSGKSKPYRKYGTLLFKLKGTTHRLSIYQGLDVIKKPGLADYLFIPFNDLTNYETTYAGGRYLDFKIGDIKNGKLMVDFNKAYNPYCAFAEGYSCPIPPVENRLQTKIEAGEQLFGRAAQ